MVAGLASDVVMLAAGAGYCGFTVPLAILWSVCVGIVVRGAGTTCHRRRATSRETAGSWDPRRSWLAR